MSDTFGQGAFDPDAAAVPPQPPETRITTNPENQPGLSTPTPQPGPTFRAPLGPTEQRDPFAQPAWPEIADAAFLHGNSTASILHFLSHRSPDATYDPNHNPLSLIKGSEFENQPELFVGDLNKDVTASKMARMRAENQRGDILAKSGSAGIAMGLAAGALDPVNYLPIFGEYAAATRFGQVAYDAARLGAFGAVTAAGSEAALHATQETRTWSESAGNIASATLLMGMLGGTLGALAPAERAAAAAELDAMRPKVGVDPATGEATVHAPADANLQPQNITENITGAANENAETPIARAVGAAPSDLRDLDLKNFGLNQLGRLSEATIDKLSPNLRVYTGESLTAKRAMGDLAETALKFTQHDEGVPTATGGGPLETMFRTAQKQMQYAAHTVVEDAWLDHRGMEEAGALTRGATAISDFRGATPEGKLSFKDFKAAVWDAMDQGDAHAIPQVQKAAQDIRKIVYDPTAKMAEQTLGPDGQPLLNEFREPPKGSQSFVDRIWNKQALIQKRPDAVRRFADYYEAEQGRHAEVQSIIGSLQKNRDRAAAEEARLTEAAAKKSGPERADLEYDARMQRAAQDRIRKGIEEQLERWGGNTTKEALAAIKKRTLAEEKGGGQVERLTGADSAVDNAVKRILDRSDLDMSREELENLANETVDRIISTPDGRIPYEGDHITSGEGFGGRGQQVRGSLNERRFAIPSQDVKDLLERDIEHVVAAHIRTVLPDVLLTQRFGDIRMTDQIRGILDDYAAKSSKEGISGKEAARLNKLKDRDIADVTAVRDRLRGTYGWTPDPTMRNVGQVIHAFHNYTTITSLGTSALNRLNDWGMQSIFRNGFMNTMGDMWAPMLKGMLQIDKEGTREIVRQARDMGIGVDGMLGHSRYNLADTTNNLRPGNTFTRGLAWGADRSMIINLHGPETDYARIFNWVAAQAEFGRVAEKIAGGTATKKDFARMADANIDPHTAARIWAEYEQHHTMVGGTRLANTGAWTDTVARDAFERAMNREANINVVQAGIGDKPLFLSRPLGSLVGQFKSFTAGATERILIANLQQGDARTLQGVISGITMGMLGYRLYTLASGQPVSDRPQDWIKEGIIRSGMGGWLMEGNNTLAKFTSGKSDVFRAIGADRPSSRRASESALSDLLGPTYSHLEGLTQALGHATYTDPKTGASAFTARDIHNLRQAGVLPVPPFVFQNLMGLRRIGDEFEDGIARSLGIKPMNREPRYGPH